MRPIGRCFLILLLPLALLGACSQSVTNADRLAVTEVSYQAALKEIVVLTDAGVIKGQTAVVTSNAIRLADAAIAVWRTDPNNPQYVKAGLAAIEPLLTLIAGLKKQRTVALGPPPDLLLPAIAWRTP